MYGPRGSPRPSDCGARTRHTGSPSNGTDRPVSRPVSTSHGATRPHGSTPGPEAASSPVSTVVPTSKSTRRPVGCASPWRHGMATPGWMSPSNCPTNCEAASCSPILPRLRVSSGRGKGILGHRLRPPPRWNGTADQRLARGSRPGSLRCVVLLRRPGPLPDGERDPGLRSGHAWRPRQLAATPGHGLQIRRLTRLRLHRVDRAATTPTPLGCPVGPAPGGGACPRLGPAPGGEPPAVFDPGCGGHGRASCRGTGAVDRWCRAGGRHRCREARLALCCGCRFPPCCVPPRSPPSPRPRESGEDVGIGCRDTVGPFVILFDRLSPGEWNECSTCC